MSDQVYFCTTAAFADQLIPTWVMSDIVSSIGFSASQKSNGLTGDYVALVSNGLDSH